VATPLHSSEGLNKDDQAFLFLHAIHRYFALLLSTNEIYILLPWFTLHSYSRGIVILLSLGIKPHVYVIFL